MFSPPWSCGFEHKARDPLSKASIVLFFSASLGGSRSLGSSAFLDWRIIPYFFLWLKRIWALSYVVCYASIWKMIRHPLKHLTQLLLTHPSLEWSWPEKLVGKVTCSWPAFLWAHRATPVCVSSRYERAGGHLLHRGSDVAPWGQDAGAISFILGKKVVLSSKIGCQRENFGICAARFVSKWSKIANSLLYGNRANRF